MVKQRHTGINGVNSAKRELRCAREQCLREGKHAAAETEVNLLRGEHSVKFR